MKDEHGRMNDLLRRGGVAGVRKRTVERPTEQSPEAKEMNAFIRRSGEAPETERAGRE